MEKQWYQSKTIIGAVLVIGASTFQAIGVTVDPVTGDFHGNVYTVLANGWPALVSIAGGGVAIWGRVKATVPIKGRRKAR